MGVGGELNHQVAHVHGATIPLQPESEMLRTRAIVHQGIGPQIVPLLANQVATFARRARLPPAEALSWFLSPPLRQIGEEAQCVGYASTGRSLLAEPLWRCRYPHPLWKWLRCCG